MHYLTLNVEEDLTRYGELIVMFNGVKLVSIMHLKYSSEMVMQAMMSFERTCMAQVTSGGDGWGLE